MTCSTNEYERSGLSNTLALWDAKGTTERNAMCVTLHAETKPQKRVGVRGFTLAEVLITLGIIGVVAALTIPTLMQKIDERETVSKVKKIYTVMNNAYENYIADNGVPNFDSSLRTTSEGAEKAFEIFRPYLKITKDCGTGNGTACGMVLDYKNKNGEDASTEFATDASRYKVLLTDGTPLWLNTGWNFYTISFDINGKKGPNKYGTDVFVFYFKDRNFYAGGHPAIGGTSTFDTGCASEDAVGHACAAWVVYKGNMEYLKCNDLSWNGKQKCD